MSGSLQDRLLWLLLVTVILGVAVWGLVALLPERSAPLGSVADFEFTDANGRSVSRSDLVGKVWIAGVTYSCCTMSCPQLRLALQQLQSELRSTKVLLVNFSAAPALDTPEQLRQLAESLQAEPERWLFLTTKEPGGFNQVRQFVRDSFQGDLLEDPEADPGKRVAHPNRLYLIDRQGTVVGSYSCVEEILGSEDRPSGLFQVNPAEVERLRADAEALYAGPLGYWLKLSWLPTLNAILNGSSGVLLCLGYVLIRLRRVRLHVVCMLTAVGVSALFLLSYLYYHAYHGATPFTGQGWVRLIYFGILLSHTILAVVVVPLVLVTLYQAWRKRFERHRWIARWTLPAWLYVSVTGVLVYLFLYHFFPA
jgi:protein SCO1/2/putative membrane protein